MTNFVRFHEYNDHEGERWNFWLQLDGNEEQIDRLAWKLNDESERQGFELWYTLHANDVEPESVVDKLVRYAARGYNPAHTKVTGKFTCPDDLGEDAENLYKGGIRAYFERDDSVGHVESPTATGNA